MVEIGNEIAASRRRILLERLVPAQRVTARVTGPILVALAALVFWRDPRWQFAAILAAAAATAIAFAWAARLSRRERIEAAVGLYLLVVIAFLTASMLLVEGLLAAAGVAALATTINASIYSRRLLAIGAIASVASFALCAAVQHFEPYPIVRLAPGFAALLDAACVALLMLQGVAYLRTASRLNEALFDSVARAAGEQRRVIEAIRGIQPVVGDAVARIREVSATLAAQASEQAAATAEVAATVSQVMQLAAQTARSATETASLAEKTRGALVDNGARVKEVERGFAVAVRAIEGTTADVRTLAARIEDIDGILRANREIGEHVKVLAVNAAIESAAAGEHGRGFQVVAAELREMIRRTDDNLRASAEILAGIKAIARASADSLHDGSAELTRCYDSLGATAATIEESARGFLATAAAVRNIEHAATEQQTGMREIDVTMGEIDRAAERLSGSTAALLAAVGSISGSQDELAGALATRAGA